jgi:thymidylate kinase
MWTERQAVVLAAVFNAMNSSGIRWMVLRNYEGLPYTNRSKDIDLALPKSDLHRTRSLVNQVLREHGFDRVFNVSFQYADCNTYFFCNEEGVHSLKLDFLDGFVWRGARIFDFDTMYARRVPYDDFFVPDQFDDGYMLWVKPLLTGGIVKDRYVQDILQCIRDHPGSFLNTLQQSFGPRLAFEVWGLLEKGDLRGTIAYQGRMRRAVWLKAVISNPWETLGSMVGHVWYEVRRRSKRNPGSMLAVVGPDGVGKTTFITLFRRELARILVKDEDDIFLEHFRPHLLPNIKQLLSGAQYNPTAEEFSRPHRAQPASAGSSLVRISYYWLDYVAGYFLRIRRHCAREYVYLFDRYFYDFVVDQRRSRLGLPLWLRKFFLRLTPQPDLVYFLDCDADIVYARKQELSHGEIARQLTTYRELAADNPNRFVCLDASQPPEFSCRKAILTLVERSFMAL